MIEYWLVMFDRHGGESDPKGPLDSFEEAVSLGESHLEEWQWVTYEIEEGDL